MAIIVNSYQEWESNQLVFASEMNQLSEDVYNKVSSMTNNTLPCIISGGQCSITGASLNISTGFFRCQDLSPVAFPFLPFPTPQIIQGLFNIDEAVLTATPNYYILAELQVSPPLEGALSYSFGGAYFIVPDLSGANYDPTTMIILGQIDNTGAVVNFTQRDYDYGNLISIISEQQKKIVSSNYQMLFIDNNVATSTANIVITLPLKTSLASYKTFTIQNFSNGIITINTADGTTIGYQTSLVINTGSLTSFIFDSNNNVWLTLGGNSFPDITDINGIVNVGKTNGTGIIRTSNGQNRPILPNLGGNNQVATLEDTSNSIPVGSLIFFNGYSSPSSSWAVANGATITNASINYPILWSWAQTHHSDMTIESFYNGQSGRPVILNGTDLMLPNIAGGAFLRNLGGNAGSLGQFQSQNFQSHLHSFVTQRIGLNGGVIVDYTGGARWCVAHDGIVDLPDNQNTGFNGGSETRPNNYAFLVLIKVS